MKFHYIAFLSTLILTDVPCHLKIGPSSFKITTTVFVLIGVVVRSTMYAKLVYNLTSVSNICIKIEEINNVLAEQMHALVTN